MDLFSVISSLGLCCISYAIAQYLFLACKPLEDKGGHDFPIKVLVVIGYLFLLASLPAALFLEPICSIRERRVSKGAVADERESQRKIMRSEINSAVNQERNSLERYYIDLILKESQMAREDERRKADERCRSCPYFLQAYESNEAPGE